MARHLFKIVGAVSLFLAIIFGWWGYFNAPTSPPSASDGAHFYGRPESSIQDIAVRLIYAVPENKQDRIYGPWEEKAKLLLEAAKAFHEIQFFGKSRISYKIYPEPVILRNISQFYDSDDTRNGNPHALQFVTLELEERTLNTAGDLYTEGFAGKFDGEDFAVLGILYEGVGAAGTEGSFILGTGFLKDSQYAESVTSIFYHELAHTLGVPEGYDAETNEPFTSDVMGAGRNGPLTETYIERETLMQMGVL